jgi:xanthine dioxygenase
MLRYDDGSGEELDVPVGTTPFVSGYRMYDLPSDSQKEFARTSRIGYGPHPSVWMSPAKSRSDGLGMISDGLELPLENLPPIDESKIQILPCAGRIRSREGMPCRSILQL